MQPHIERTNEVPLSLREKARYCHRGLRDIIEFQSQLISRCAWPEGFQICDLTLCRPREPTDGDDELLEQLLLRSRLVECLHRDLS